MSQFTSMRVLASVLGLGLGLALVGCQLPSNVLYRCELDGGCAQPGLICLADQYCHDTAAPPPDGSVTMTDGGPCVPLSREVACAGSECGSADDGCGGSVACPGSCVAPLQCSLDAPHRCEVPSLCTGEGWCWEHPLPQGHSLSGSWQLDAEHRWFVGEAHVVLFSDGQRLRLEDVPSPTTLDLLSVHAREPKEVFAVGTGGLIVHFDGTRWEREGAPSGTGTLRVVRALGDGGAIAVGQTGRILRRTAQVDPFTRWRTETIGTTDDLRDVFENAGVLYVVTRRNEVYVEPVTGDSDWTRLDVIPLQDSFAAIARAGGVTFAGNAAARGSIVHRDADGGWTTLLENAFNITDLIRGDGGVFAFGAGNEAAWIADDGTLTRFPVNGPWLTGVAVDGPQLLAAGPAGVMGLVSVDGGEVPLSSPRVRLGLGLNAICRSGDSFVATGGADSLGCGQNCDVRWLERTETPSGTLWEAQSAPMGSTTQLVGCFAASPEQTWLMGNDGSFLARSPGSQWSQGNFGNAFAGRYTGAWGTPDAGYFFTRGESPRLTISRDGLTNFSDQSVNAAFGLGSVWGVAGDDLVVVGKRGTWVHSDGTSWQTSPLVSVTSDLLAVHGVRLDDGGTRYVAVGSQTTVTQETDAPPMPQSVAGDLRAVWVSARGVAWAGGVATDGGALLLRGEPGHGWSPEPFSSPRGVRGIAGRDLPDGGVRLWTIGPAGAVIRRDVSVP